MPTDAVALATMREPDWLRGASRRVSTAMNAPRPVVADGLLVYGLLVPIVVPIVATLAYSGRVLPIDANRTSVTLLRNGSVDRLWLRTSGAAPSADRRSGDARQIDEAATLLLALTRPTAAAATSTLRIGRRQVWRLVGDLVVRTTNDVLQDQELTHGFATALLTACGAPIAFAPRWERVATRQGQIDRPRSRSCCLGYQIENMAYCAGCPREAEPARTARLAEYLSS